MGQSDRGNINEYQRERESGTRGQRAISDWVLKEHLLNKVMPSRAQKEGREPGQHMGKIFWVEEAANAKALFEKSWEPHGQGDLPDEAGGVWGYCGDFSGYWLICATLTGT